MKGTIGSAKESRKSWRKADLKKYIDGRSEDRSLYEALQDLVRDKAAELGYEEPSYIARHKSLRLLAIYKPQNLMELDDYYELPDDAVRSFGSILIDTITNHIKPDQKHERPIKKKAEKELVSLAGEIELAAERKKNYLLSAELEVLKGKVAELEKGAERPSRTTARITIAPGYTYDLLDDKQFGEFIKVFRIICQEHAQLKKRDKAYRHQIDIGKVSSKESGILVADFRYVRDAKKRKVFEDDQFQILELAKLGHLDTALVRVFALIEKLTRVEIETMEDLAKDSYNKRWDKEKPPSDWTMFEVLSVLSETGVLTNSVMNRVHRARELRNSLLHDDDANELNKAEFLYTQETLNLVCAELSEWHTRN